MSDYKYQGVNTLNAIITLATCGVILLGLLYSLRRNPKVKIYYFFLLAILCQATAAIFVLFVSNIVTSWFGANIASWVGNCLFITAFSYLYRIWISSVEWEIGEASVKSGRRGTIVNLVTALLFTVLHIVNIGLYLGQEYDANVTTACIIAFDFGIAAGLACQTFTLGYIHIKESSDLPKRKLNQLRRLALLSALQFVSMLLFALANWFPSLYEASTFVQIVWLVVAIWPGALNGYDENDESSGAGRKPEMKQTPFA